MMANILLIVSVLMHPFHVSVSDIKYKEEKKVIQISTRIFLDDLELALQEFSDDSSLDIMDDVRWEFIEAQLSNYVLERFKLWDEKEKPYTLNFIGAEIEDDVMWCYVEVEKVKKLKQVRVSNSLLHEVWADQENLVHFRAFDKVRSARLFKGEESRVFNWED